MPHALQHVLDHAGELAQRVSDWQPEPDDVRDAAPLRAVADAVIARGEVEAQFADALRASRKAGHTWPE